MQVKNMRSAKGNTIPNQFIITDGDVEYFQSYETIIAKYVDGQVYLDATHWDYSRTTSKYRNQFLNATSQEVKERMAMGDYPLINLNGGSK
jgi:hypothetical protein